MIKYRLRKWYPSLPKDWTEGIEIIYEPRRGYFISLLNYPISTECAISTGMVPTPEVDYTSFWEKVEEEEPKYYPVATKGGHGFIPYTFIDQMWEKPKEKMKLEDFEYFKSEEEARKFIEWKKPKYSKQDMCDVMYDLGSRIRSTIHNIEFEEFIPEKK